jgi:hypothetical protein
MERLVRYEGALNNVRGGTGGQMGCSLGGQKNPRD